VDIVKNSILTKSEFPVGYYAHGEYDDKCYTVYEREMKFCEDETFWEYKDNQGSVVERRVIISCDPGRQSWNTVMGPLRDPEPHGSLWIYNPQGSHSPPRRIELEGYPAKHDFHPLGLEIYPSFSGNSSNLFVVNHARTRTVIEQFVLSPSQPQQAQWVRTISSPYFISPNALALTSPSSFYVTNDHLLTRRLSGILGQVLPISETLLGLPLSWVGHVTLDEKTGDIEHTFAKYGIPFANGISISPDGQTVAVAATSMNQIQFYTRSSNLKSLKHAYSVPTPFSPDNIAFTENGELIVGGHPHFPTLTQVAKNLVEKAPSWVVSISPRPIDVEAAPFNIKDDLNAPISTSSKVSSIPSHQVQTLFQSNGTGFSSSSAGLVDSSSGKLFVTGLYETGLLVCNPQS
jgi:hypothetical protein